MSVNHAERAAELRKEGCNCAQAVLGAYCEELGLPEETAKLMTAGYGNGLGNGQGTCGAVLSGILVLGLRHGTNRTPVKTKFGTFRDEFQRCAGELTCFKLRQGQTPCGDLVALAVELLDTEEQA
ncbi:MAG: C-GCAxxG-C-C family protein [Oscillospiraceae bacterium]|jgi:C_GCAxxG_C_C family probable redox protein|nr:C-GCAxxG-C-C family protein [Oscillospiraceae bacterium]